MLSMPLILTPDVLSTTIAVYSATAVPGEGGPVTSSPSETIGSRHMCLTHACTADMYVVFGCSCTGMITEFSFPVFLYGITSARLLLLLSTIVNKPHR